MRNLVPFVLLALPPSSVQETEEAREATNLLTLVPAESMTFLHVADMPGLRDDLFENSWYRMMRDEELNPLWSTIAGMPEWSEIFDDEELDPFELMDSIQGSFVIFMASAGEEQPAGGVLIDPGAGAEQLDEFHRKLAEHSNDVMTTEVYEGIELAWIGSPGDQQVQFELDGIRAILFSEDREEAMKLATDLIARKRGEGDGKSVVSNPLLIEARKAGPTGRIEFFADTHALVALIPDIEPDEEVQPWLDALGLAGMTWVHGSIDMGKGEELDLRVRVRIPDSGYINEWMDFFGPAPVELARLAPEDCMSLALYNYDLWSLYESAWDLFAEVDPEAYEEGRDQFDMMMQSVGGLDFETDLLSQLDGRFASYTIPISAEEWLAGPAAAQLGGVAESPSEELLYGEAYLIGFEDATEVELFVEELINVAGLMIGLDAGQIETEEVEGWPVNSLAFPFGNLQLSWCFTEDFGLFTMYPSTIRTLLALEDAEDAEDAPRTVLDNELFSPFLERHAGTSALGITPTAPTVKAMLGMLRMVALEAGGPEDWNWDNTGAGGDMGWSFDNDASGTDFGWENDEMMGTTGWPFDPALMPRPELVDRHLHGSVVFTIERIDGALEMVVYGR